MNDATYQLTQALISKLVSDVSVWRPHVLDIESLDKDLAAIDWCAAELIVPRSGMYVLTKGTNFWGVRTVDGDGENIGFDLRLATLFTRDAVYALQFKLGSCNSGAWKAVLYAEALKTYLNHLNLCIALVVELAQVRELLRRIRSSKGRELAFQHAETKLESLFTLIRDGAHDGYFVSVGSAFAKVCITGIDAEGLNLCGDILEARLMTKDEAHKTRFALSTQEEEECTVVMAKDALCGAFQSLIEAIDTFLRPADRY